MTENDFTNYWEYFLQIDEDLMKTNRYIQHTEKNLKAYSSEFARIILVACAEIDTICRLLCKEIDSSCDFPNDSTRSGDIKEYCKIIIGQYPKLPTTEIVFTTLQEKKKPWDGWANLPTYKSPNWWKEYQLIKHYRHNNFEKATLENSLFAVSSLLVLLMYLHKKVFGYTRSIKTGDPVCFFSRSLLDFDDAEFGNEYDAKQLPDFFS